MVVMPKPIRPSGAGLANLVLPKFEKMIFSECLLFKVLAMKNFIPIYVGLLTNKQGIHPRSVRLKKRNNTLQFMVWSMSRSLMQASLRFGVRILHKVRFSGFINAVKAGVISSDSWLYVENLDRLTRQDVMTALNLFTSLLKLGLTIVTGMDGKIYTEESISNNVNDLIMSLFLFSRANEESLTKQNVLMKPH